MTSIQFILEILCCNHCKVSFDVSNLDKILKILKQKLNLIAQVFLKLSIPKDVVNWISKSSYIRTLFGSQLGNESQTLLKSTRHHLYPIVSTFSVKLSWNISLLVKSETLGVFLNTWMVDDKHSFNSYGEFAEATWVVI